MVIMFVIKAKKRDESVKLDNLRKGGEMPAVFYGAGKTTTPISISVSEFKKVWREAGESSTVKITVGTESVDALIHEVQVHPVTESPVHVDFLVVDMNKKIKVNIALEFTGVSNAVKGGLGNLVKVLHEVEVEALPKDLPHNLIVDISKLATLEDQIFVSDIKLPTGVTLITPESEVVASVVPQVEEKEEVAAPVDLTSIEVEKKGKKEEEGSEAPEETK
jgi:large subunit ribosomal protein L25